MLLRRPLHLNVCPRRRHLLLYFLRRSHLSCCPSLAVAGPLDTVDLWIAKIVSTVFILSPSPSAAAARLVAVRHVLSPSAAAAAVGRLPDPSSAMHLFGITREDLGVAHSAAGYGSLIVSLRRSGRHQDALKMFDEMASQGHCKDGSFLVLLIDSCLEAHQLDLALGLLERASKYGCCVRTYTFNKLLGLLIARNRAEDAVFMLRAHIRSQILDPDTYSFNIVIKALCRMGDIDTAFELFAEMEDCCCLPDAVTHNILVDGLCKSGRVDRAHGVLLRIQSDGSCLPNVITYTSVITGYCRIGKMVEAFGVFSEMTCTGIKPSRVTYNVLIDGYGKSGDMQSAVSIYDRMLVSGCPPDVVTFTSLINGYCRGGQLDDAMRLWSEMCENELKPNAYTFSVIISSLCRKNRLNEARDLLKELTGRRDIVPQPFIYNPVIDGLCKAGNVDEANVVLVEMESRSCPPDKFSYTILIIGHCMKGRTLEAIEIFHKMLSSGCVPDSITISSLVSCLLKAGMPDEGKQIMLIASRKDFHLDMSTSQEIPSIARSKPNILVAV